GAGVLNDPFKDADSLGDDLGADAIAGDDRDPKRHRLSISGARGRKFWRPSPIPLHSADRGDCAERGAGQDAPSPPRPPLISPHLLGDLGIRRAGLPRFTRRRHRRSGVGLSAPTLPSPRGGGSL